MSTQDYNIVRAPPWTLMKCEAEDECIGRKIGEQTNECELQHSQSVERHVARRISKTNNVNTPVVSHLWNAH